MTLRTPKWLFDQGASPEALNALRSAVGVLPEDYLELLRQGNGGEVELKVSPLVLCLDSAEAALDYWNSGTYPINGIFVFGGNGGGDLLAFDLSSSDEFPVISFDPIDPEGSMSKVASDFKGLLALAREADA